jgi:hypothetical protein
MEPWAALSSPKETDPHTPASNVADMLRFRESIPQDASRPKTHLGREAGPTVDQNGSGCHDRVPLRPVESEHNPQRRHGWIDNHERHAGLTRH